MLEAEHRDQITSLVMTEDMRYMISGSLDERIFVWSLETRQLAKKLHSLSAGVLVLKLSAGDKLLLSGGADN